MIKKPKSTRPVGRPPLNLPTKPRHFHQIQATENFDSAILKVRQALAQERGVEIETISITRAVQFATAFTADYKILTENACNLCPRCGGFGIIAIKNGDDDQPCPECSE